MKKLFGTLLTGALLLGAVCVITPQFTKDAPGEISGILDRFNPLVATSEVYIKTKAPDAVNSYGTATYRQTAVDRNGKTRKIEFNGLSELNVDRYLKLKNKGAYVETYEEVSAKDLPEKALAYLG